MPFDADTSKLRIDTNSRYHKLCTYMPSLTVLCVRTFQCGYFNVTVAGDLILVMIRWSSPAEALVLHPVVQSHTSAYVEIDSVETPCCYKGSFHLAEVWGQILWLCLLQFPHTKWCGQLRHTDASPGYCAHERMSVTQASHLSALTGSHSEHSCRS